MPKKKSAKTREDVIIEKAMTAKALLYIHGLTNETENHNIHRRMVKLVENHQKKKATNP